MNKPPKTQAEKRELGYGATKVECLFCEKEFSARNSIINRGYGKYCSRKCYYDHTRKNEFVDYNGLRYYLSPTIGYFVSECGKRLNRAIWEDNNGVIPDGYIIHHIDGSKTNNEIENLEMIEWGKHTAVHHEKTRERNRALKINPLKND